MGDFVSPTLAEWSFGRISHVTLGRPAWGWDARPDAVAVAVAVVVGGGVGPRVVGGVVQPKVQPMVQPMPVTCRAVVQLVLMAVRAADRVMRPEQTAFFSLVSTPSLVLEDGVP